ncbi:hypothetical protein QYM36_017481 [Artemia franciscana]|uniref:Uncharacterized protein n=1 Tax=Artemia franciscana TaxID=6661 RepID=A0AA88KS78_ARTSF|nr:hypothetical protein QYM36_017481 [Artemia franciscana]
MIPQLITTGIPDEYFHRIINESKLLERTSLNETDSDDITLEELHHLVNEEKLLGEDITDEYVIVDLARKNKTCNLDIPVETPAVTTQVREAASDSSVKVEVQIELSLPDVDKDESEVKVDSSGKPSKTGASEEGFYNIVNETKVLENTSFCGTESEECKDEVLLRHFNDKKLIGKLTSTSNTGLLANLAHKRKTCSQAVSEKPKNKKNRFANHQNSNCPTELYRKHGSGIRQFPLGGTNQKSESSGPEKFCNKQRCNYEKEELSKKSKDLTRQENKQISCQIEGMSILHPNPRHTNDKEVLWKDRKDATEQENRHISSQVWGKLVSPELPPLHPTLRTDEKTLLINELGTVKTTIE